MALKPWIGATLAKEGFDLVHRALPTTRPPASKEITTTGSQARGRQTRAKPFRRFDGGIVSRWSHRGEYPERVSVAREDVRVL
jgi:hypothetical protein